MLAPCMFDQTKTYLIRSDQQSLVKGVSWDQVSVELLREREDRKKRNKHSGAVRMKIRGSFPRILDGILHDSPQSAPIGKSSAAHLGGEKRLEGCHAQPYHAP